MKCRSTEEKYRDNVGLSYPQFVFGVVFLLSAVSVSFSADGVSWMWHDQPVVGAVFLAVSIFFWVQLALRTKRDHGSTPR